MPPLSLSNLSGFTFSSCSRIFVPWSDTRTLATPNSYPFSSVTRKRQQSFSLLGSGKIFTGTDFRVGPGSPSQTCVHWMKPTIKGRRRGRDAEWIKQSRSPHTPSRTLHTFTSGWRVPRGSPGWPSSVRSVASLCGESPLAARTAWRSRPLREKVLLCSLPGFVP